MINEKTAEAIECRDLLRIATAIFELLCQDGCALKDYSAGSRQSTREAQIW